jgi:hypothetical protein
MLLVQVVIILFAALTVPNRRQLLPHLAVALIAQLNVLQTH